MKRVTQLKKEKQRPEGDVNNSKFAKFDKIVLDILMGRTKLTRQEIVALLITIRDELKILFEELDLEQSIVTDLASLIKKEFNVDPENKKIYEIFNK